MSDREIGQQKRPRAREQQWTAPASVAVAGERNGTLDTVVDESSWGNAQETLGGHSYSSLDVFARDDRSDDRDGSSFAPAATQTAVEVEPRDKEVEDTARGHRFSSIDVFPREDQFDRRRGDRATTDLEDTNGRHGSAPATMRTEIEPQARTREVKPKVDDGSNAAGTTSEESALTPTPRVASTLASQALPPPDASRLTSPYVAAGASPKPLAHAGEARVAEISSPPPAAREAEKPAEPSKAKDTVGEIDVAAEKDALAKRDVVAEKPQVEPIDADGKVETSEADAKAKREQVDGVKKKEGGKDASDEAKPDGAEAKGAGGRVATAGQPGREGGKGQGRGGRGSGGAGGGVGSVGGGGGGGAAAAGGSESGSLNDAALDRWTAATSAAVEAVPAPELPEGAAGATAIEQTATGVVNERAATEPDYESEAKESQEPLPEAAEKQSQLDTSEAEKAVADVQALSNKRLSPATFSPVGAPPAYPGLNPRDFVPANDLKVLKDLEDRLANKDLTKAERVSLTKQLEKVQAHIAGIEERAAKGTAPAPPLTVVDEGASSLTPPSPDQAAVLGDAIARAITTIPGRGESLALSAADPLDQGKCPPLQELAKGKASTVESEMRKELEQIATAAGISAEQLTGKIAEQKEAAAKLAAEQDEAAKGAAKKGVEAREQQGVEEQKKISGAKQAVEKEIAAKESAVDGPPDTEAIEAKRDEFLGKLERSGSEVLASYRSSLEKRTGELNEAAGKQKGEIRSAADRQAAAIRRHFQDDPDKGAVESLPTKNWATTAAQQVDVEKGRFTREATTENKGFVDALNEQLSSARNTVRDWAAHQEGRERSWWEQLFDMIRDWGKQAVANNEAWERQRAADSRDAMAGDLDVLAQLRKAQLSKNNDELNSSFAGLDAEQKVLAAKYLRGEGVDSIGFVAESTMLRIVRRRRGELTESLREEVLRDWDWEQLGVLARATNPEFQPKVIANKVKGSIAGMGTSEDKLFAALGTARGPFERAAVEKCYQATFGISMAEDVDDDVDGTEWKRADALMKGETADIAVATIADAVSGAGTDEDAIKEALRGKTPAELEEIKRLYKERHGVELETELKDEMEDAELDNALALARGNIAEADAADLEDAMEGAGTDEEKITQVYEKIRKEVEADAKRRGLSVAEMNAEITRRNQAVAGAYAAKYGKSLKSEFADELSGAELTLADALDSGNASRIDAAKAKVEDEALVYSSDDRLEDIVRNQHTRAETEAKLDLESQRARAAEALRSGDIDRAQYDKALADYETNKKNIDQDIAKRAKQNMQDLKGQYGTMAVGGEAAFDVMITMRAQGNSEDEIKKLIESGGKLSPEDEIFFAVEGAGTDEDMIKKTLAGKTPEEIQKIRDAYNERYKPRNFDDDILSDLSGREDLDTKLILEMGDPSTFATQLRNEKDPAKRAELLAKMERYLEERKKFEETGSIGSSMLATGSDQMNTLAQMEDAMVAARNLDEAIARAGGNVDDPAVIDAQHRMDMNFSGAVEAQEQFRAQIDAYADIAVQVGAAIAGIAVTVATLGAGAPFAVAAMWGAAASAATGIYMNADLRGAAYSWEEAGVDVAVGVVDVAAAGLGAKYLGPLVKQAGMLQFAAGALADGLEGVPSALLEAGMDEAIWASGNPGGAMLKVGGMALGTGAALSAGLDAAGGAYGMVTGPKVKAGAPSLDMDIDVGAGSHARGPDVDVDVPGASRGHGADIDAPKGDMPELDVPPVADPAVAARKAAEGELPPGAPEHAPKSPSDTDAKLDTDNPPTGATPDSPDARQPHVGEDGIVDLDDPRNRWMVEDSMAGQLPDELAADPVASRRFFEDFVGNQPEIEAGLLRNSETGEHIVVQGSPASVDIRSGHGAWEGLIPPEKLGKGRWDLVVHSHPVDASGVTPGWAQVPSGADGDFAWTVYQAQASGKPVVQEIHITTERGPDVTRYGYDPTSATPYSIDFPRPDGTREVHAFATIDDYHNFYKQRFGGDLGPIPDDFAGVKQADTAKTDTTQPVDEPASELDGFDDEPTVEIPVTPETPTTVPSAPKTSSGSGASKSSSAKGAGKSSSGKGTPKASTAKGKSGAAAGAPTTPSASLTTGRPGMAKVVAANPELATRLDAAVAALDKAAGGLTNADRAAIHALFAPTMPDGGIGVGRLEQRIGSLERIVGLIGQRPELLSVDGQRKLLKVLQHEGKLVLDAFDAGVTQEQAGRATRPSAKLQAEMDHLRALLAAPPEPGSDMIDGLLRLEQLQRDIGRGSEVLRSKGESLWDIHTPDHPAPSKVDADEVREAIVDAGGLKSMKPAEVLSATEVMDLDISATGTLGEPLARNLPDMGQERKLLTPREIGELKTDPPGLGKRLAEMLAGYHRAHMVGPGFGDELFAGLMLAPADFNLDTQNKGIEALLRALRATGEDVEVSIHATGTRHAIPMKDGSVKHVDVLDSITYTVTRPNGDVMVVKYDIGAPPGGKVTMSTPAGGTTIPGLTVDGLPEPPD